MEEIHDLFQGPMVEIMIRGRLPVVVGRMEATLQQDVVVKDVVIMVVEDEEDVVVVVMRLVFLQQES